MLKKIMKISLLALWMAFIFYLSNQPDVFYPKIFSWQGLAAHVCLYFVLSFLFSSASANYFKDDFEKIFLFSFLFSLLYGATDEFHQSFISGRSASGEDLVIDGLGAGAGAFIFFRLFRSRKPKLLLHICCIGCGAYIVRELKEKFNLELFFYNPNIFPAEEYQTRLEEAERTAKKFGVKLTVDGGDHGEWLKSVKGLESEPERGARCLVCYHERLERTAVLAKEKGFDFFATTLTISPHKDALAITKIGQELEQQHGVKYLDRDFKENDGFKKSCQLSRELNLYRQSYCGCEFSIRRQADK